MGRSEQHCPESSRDLGQISVFPQTQLRSKGVRSLLSIIRAIVVLLCIFMALVWAKIISSASQKPSTAYMEQGYRQTLTGEP